MSFIISFSASIVDFSPGDVVIIEQVDSKYGQKGWVLCAHRCFDRDKRNDGSTYVNLHADSSDRSAKKWKILKESDGSFIIKQDDTAYGQKDWVLCSHRVYNKDKRNNDSSFVIVHTDSSDR